MMTGRVIRADGHILGIALRIEEDVLSEDTNACRDDIAKGPVAIRLVKKIVDSTDRVDLDVGLAAEAGAFGLCFATQINQGMQSFLEKRPEFMDNKSQNGETTSLTHQYFRFNNTLENLLRTSSD